MYSSEHDFDFQNLNFSYGKWESVTILSASWDYGENLWLITVTALCKFKITLY